MKKQHEIYDNALAKVDAGLGEEKRADKDKISTGRDAPGETND